MKSNSNLSLLLIGVTCASALFAQDNLDLGFENGSLEMTPQDWFVPTEGWTAELTDEKANEGSRSVKLSLPGESRASFGNLMRTLDATPYRGRRTVLRAKMLVQGAGGGQMWLRVDRMNGEMGTFDNMELRPILAGDWKEAVIGAEIDDDGEFLNIGFMSNGGATVFIDGVSLVDMGGGPKVMPQSPSDPRPLSPRGLENLTAAARLLSYVRFFHPSDQAVGVTAWDHFAVHLMERAEPATDADDLVKRLDEVFRPIAPTLQLWAGAPEHAPPGPEPPETATDVKSWKHIGVSALPSTIRQMETYRSGIEILSVPPKKDSDPKIYVVKSLGSGVSCRLPVKCYADDKGTIPHGKTPDEWEKTEGRPSLTALNRSTRLAGVALGWGVMQHFYPYFEVVNTDWKEALVVTLTKAAEDRDKIAYLDTLREMLAKLHDGHADVSNRSLATPSFLPLALEWAGNDLVVVGSDSSVGDAVRIGDVVEAMDGRSAQDCYDQVSKWISAATDGWRRWKSIQRLMINLPTEDPVRITLRRPEGLGYSIMPHRVKEMPVNVALQRPANGSEPARGIAYFNLDGATTDELNRSMTKLEAACGIIFDLRGYPSDGAVELMSHLIDSPAASARWIVPISRLPDREEVEWLDLERWSLQPQSPRLKGRIAFLTDGRAISYAESILGIVEHYKLGDIVGSTTAGTNGNVNPFTLPGGYIVSWTGMKVLKHDGSQHHGVGIAPTVPVVPTPAGIAAGRDEVLEKAVEVLQAKLGSGRGEE